VCEVRSVNQQKCALSINRSVLCQSTEVRSVNQQKCAVNQQKSLCQSTEVRSVSQQLQTWWWCKTGKTELSRREYV